MKQSKHSYKSIGRSIRGKDDQAITYILDGSFEWFYRKNLDIFPLILQKCLLSSLQCHS